LSRNKAAKRIQTEELQRPDAYLYHDYRSFLRDWFAYLKETLPRFSLRILAGQAELGSGYLPMVLNGKRSLSHKVLLKLAPHLQLTEAELKHLANLVQFDAPDSLPMRVLALKNMRRSFTYMKRHPNEVEFFEYMAHWHYIAIREMSTLEGFRADAQWIRARLKWKIPLSKIREAIDFLISNGYLKLSPDGTNVLPAKDALACDDKVFSTALKQYHQQMLNLAGASLDHTPPDQREHHGYTFAISSSRFEEVQKIILNAIQAVQAIEKSEDRARDSLYHMELVLFPLAGAKSAGEKS
jgi:uncharacterized protein (TIGR02147 family)